jgi:hypothetical protein
MNRREVKVEVRISVEIDLRTGDIELKIRRAANSVVSLNLQKNLILTKLNFISESGVQRNNCSLLNNHDIILYTQIAGYLLGVVGVWSRHTIALDRKLGPEVIDIILRN